MAAGLRPREEVTTPLRSALCEVGGATKHRVPEGTLVFEWHLLRVISFVCQLAMPSSAWHHEVPQNGLLERLLRVQLFLRHVSANA